MMKTKQIHGPVVKSKVLLKIKSESGLQIFRSIKILTFAIVLLISPIFVFTYSFHKSSASNVDPEFVWAKSMGGSDFETARDMIVDASGNVYTTGDFYATGDFDPGAGTEELTNVGNSDIFVSKLDTDGNFVWAKSMAGLGDESGYSLALDNDGNIYITGFFGDTVDFDPGAGTEELTPVGSTDIFVLKLDSDGNFLWVKQIGGTDNDSPFAMSLDNDNNLLLTGDFNDVVDFDPGAGTEELTSGGGNDVFILKLGSDGNFVWVRAVGGTGSDIGRSIYFDDNNVYISGEFYDTVDFDPGAGTEELTSGGDSDVFILKLDSDGNFVWVRAVGGVAQDYPQGVTVDSSQNIYINGTFGDTVDFDPGAGTEEIVGTGSTNAFILKLDGDGNFVWAKGLIGIESSSIESYSVSLDSSGNIYTTGYYYDTVDFDPGVGTVELTPQGDSDNYILKLDEAGNFLWVGSMGGTGQDDALSLVLDGDDNLYASGYFNDTADFDPGDGTQELTSAGDGDIFVLKFTQADIVVPETSSSSGSVAKPKKVFAGLQFPPDYVYLTNNNSTSTGQQLSPAEFAFNKDLFLGMNDVDVKALQRFLNVNHFEVAPEGPGSLSNETNFYGPLTAAAVTMFQETFKDQILTPLGLNIGTGYLGPMTRSFINSLLN